MKTITYQENATKNIDTIRAAGQNPSQTRNVGLD